MKLEIVQDAAGATRCSPAAGSAACVGWGAAATYTKYYMAFGRVLVSRAGTIGTNGNVTYFLADHLGSSTTTITGGVATHVKYWPFGAWRSGTPPQRGYTGQQREANSPIGAYYYHARFYSTTLGHFMSADPTTADGLNRYAYVRWNPLRHTDPTGECINSDGCSIPEILTILQCGFTGKCQTNYPTEDMARISLAVMREREFAETTRRLAGVHSVFNAVVRSIRQVIHLTGGSQLELDDARVFRAAQDFEGSASGTGRVSGYDISISYLDVFVEAYGSAEKSDVGFWAGFFAALVGAEPDADLALEVHVKLNYGPWERGTSNHDVSSVYGSDIRYEDLATIEVYTSLTVKMTGNIIAVRDLEGDNDSPTSTYQIPLWPAEHFASR